MPRLVQRACSRHKVGKCDLSRDGFADFYGYDEAEAGMPQPGCSTTASETQDEFARFHSYADGDLSLPQSPVVFLPDRDPCSPRSEKMQSQRQMMQATETSLALVRSTIEDKRALLAQLQDTEADQLRWEIHQLKLQQMRLADAIWHQQTSAPKGNTAAPEFSFKGRSADRVIPLFPTAQGQSSWGRLKSRAI